MDHEYSKESNLLYQGMDLQVSGLNPESMPCYFTTAFVMDDLSQVRQTSQNGGYTYIRKSNPNRTALAGAISYLEEGEDSLIFASGMAAITTAMLTLLESGDHVICNNDIYGETFEVMTKILPKLGVDVSFVNLWDLSMVEQALRPETKMIYTEVVSNPVLALADIEALAALVHGNGGYLMVDNTFTTPIAICPMKLGADLVVNSLTKFLNGHSDAMGGSLTASKKLIDRIQPMSMICGTPGDAFSSWLIFRGLQTADLRIKKQMENAAELAAELSCSKYVSGVNHPSLPGYPQRELAERMFRPGHCCAMLSFEVPENLELIDRFMSKLHFPHYAPTLGGFRTSLSHPVTSSHYNVPDEVRRARGITPGLIRVSVGIENPEDLIRDFHNALEVFA